MLLEQVQNFCAGLRDKHQFRLGIGEIADAMRTFELLGISSFDQTQAALRAVLCAKLEDIDIFDAEFYLFCYAPKAGLPQLFLPPQAQPKERTDKPADNPNLDTQEQPSQDDPEDDPNFVGQAAKQSPADDDPNATRADRWMRGLFSAANAESEAPKINASHLEPMLLAAAQVVRTLRLGRSRKWRSLPNGARFDFRKTLRHSLSTGGEAVQPFWLGHPKRNPRLVLLLDGSRSMLPHSQSALQFAYALAQRSRRVDVFAFSTELSDISLYLKQRQLELPNLQAAWGGGTRIGDNLRLFLRDHAPRVLTADTLLIISSDGLDVGETSLLESSMREIKRRCAGIIWLNPLSSHPEFKPTARGMKTALPFISKLTHADTAEEFSKLVDGFTWR